MSRIRYALCATSLLVIAAGFSWPKAEKEQDCNTQCFQEYDACIAAGILLPVECWRQMRECNLQCG